MPIETFLKIAEIIRLPSFLKEDLDSIVSAIDLKETNNLEKQNNDNKEALTIKYKYSVNPSSLAR